MLLFVLIPCVLLLGIYFMFSRKKNNDNQLLKTLAIILFIAFAAQSEFDLAIDFTQALSGGVFPAGMTLFIMIQRWFIGVMIIVAIVTPFFPTIKSFRNLMRFVTPVLLLLNLIFFPQHLLAFFGPGVQYSHQFRFYAIVLEKIVLVLMSTIYLYRYLHDHEEKVTKNEIKTMLLLFFALLPAMMPQNFLSIVFGPYGAMAKKFTFIHRISLYFTFAIIPVLYFALKNKSAEVRKAAMLLMSLASVFQYVYVRRLGLGALPFHLCNTAIFLMLLSFAFNIKSVFFFSYFVNVLGAMVALLLPNTTNDAFNMHSVMFYYNHINAVILPILAVALRVFPRPKFKMIKGAIIIFTIYFISMMFINAWFNNYEAVDYFFLYSDFLTDMFTFGIDIKINNILIFTGYGLIFKFYWLYDLIIYVGFIILMFIIWAIYDYVFKASDQLGALFRKLKMDQMDQLELKKALKGRPLNEPIDQEGIHMIQIEHFTKRYGNAKKAAVEDLNLVINDGDIFGFLGHNGAGKSTTIKSLVGIQNITSGKMIIAGYDISKQPIEAKLRIGYVSDNHAVYERLTGREYVNYIADLYLVNQQIRDERIEKYVKMFHLEQAIDHEIKSYSHGMKQKIVVIASLIHDPKVWILDEPLTGLDPVSAFQIKECMKEHASRGNIVFFSSHIIEVVEKICNRIAIISKGKLQGVYEIAKLHENNTTLEELYMQQVAKEQNP